MIALADTTHHRNDERPTGTVTFMLTDIEQSTRLWEASPDAAMAIARHQELIDEIVSAHGGVRPEEQGEGDSTVSVFESAVEAVAAASAIQRGLSDEAWPRNADVRVRIGLHTGEAELRDARNYTGVAVHRCARLRDIAHGGQTVASSVTASIVGDALPDGVTLVDLGHHRLRDLSRAEQVFEVRHQGLDREFPPLRSLDIVANNLPGQATTFVGRSDELVVVEKLLLTERVVTLTGPGGSGKTRLAVQAAADLADHWPDGVWWIDLTSISDSTLVPEAVAATLRLLVDPSGGPMRAVRSQLRDRRLLLCLDNCEHVLDACAELADVVNRDCPGVSVLATSREALGVAGEKRWHVPSMYLEQAVRLFAERAGLVRPDFTVDDSNESTVARLCERLDGIPLAIELAAAWVRALTPAQIEAGLDDRFRLLVGGPRTVDARQQTLAASVEWSHDLLDEVDRTVLRRLAVFAGGFTLDAAHAVCAGEPVSAGEVLVCLGRLVDKSLVVADDGSAGGEVRYRMLETIRQYALQRLDEADEIGPTRDRHLGHLVTFASEAAPALESEEQDAWLARLEAEHDNLRMALDWGLRADVPDPVPGRSLAAALSRWWFVHGHSHEGIRSLTRAIELAPDDRSALQSTLFAGLAGVAAIGGQHALLAESAERGIELAATNGDDRSRGRCLALSAYLGFFSDFAGSRERCIEAGPYAEAADDPFAGDLALLLEALSWTNCSRHDRAAPLLDETADRCLRHGDRFIGAFVLHGQVYASLFGGDVRRAVRLGTEALELAQPLGDYFTVGSVRSNLAWAMGVAGELDTARELIELVVRAVEAAGPDVDVPPISWSIAKIHLWGGDLDRAIEWATRGVRYAAPMTDNLVVAWSRPVLACALRWAGRLDEAREQATLAVELGRQLDVPHAVADGLDEQAFLVADSDPEGAEDLHHEALAIRRELGMQTFMPDSLDALARRAADVESFAEATRVLGASDAARERIGYPRPALAASAHDVLVDTIRRAIPDTEFEAAYAEGSELGLDDAIGYVTRARGSRDRPSSGWASLTPTEIEVARAVADGLSNPEIGARLFVSRATVKTHLSHIYAKLGVSNRTELAMLASTRL